MVQEKTTLFKVILNLIHIDSGDITLLDKDYKDVDKNKIGCTLANISLCEYLKLKDLINLLNNTYKDFDLDYFLQKCKQYQFPLDKKSMNSLRYESKTQCFNCLITSCLISYSRRTNKWFRCSCLRRNH